MPHSKRDAWERGNRGYARAAACRASMFFTIRDTRMSEHNALLQNTPPQCPKRAIDSRRDAAPRCQDLLTTYGCNV